MNNPSPMNLPYIWAALGLNRSHSRAEGYRLAEHLAEQEHALRENLDDDIKEVVCYARDLQLGHSLGCVLGIALQRSGGGTKVGLT